MSKEQFDAAYLGLRRLYREHDIVCVVMEYEGSGDSGQWNISSVVMDTADDSDETVADEALRMINDDQIGYEDYAYREHWDGEAHAWVKTREKRFISLKEIADILTGYALQMNCGGWEINEGSRGEVLLYGDHIEINHDQYVLETVSSKHHMECTVESMEVIADRLQAGR